MGYVNGEPEPLLEFKGKKSNWFWCTTAGSNVRNFLNRREKLCLTRIGFQSGNFHDKQFN